MQQNAAVQISPQPEPAPETEPASRLLTADIPANVQTVQQSSADHPDSPTMVLQGVPQPHTRQA